MKFITESESVYEYDTEKSILIRLTGDHENIRADFGQEMKVLEVLQPVEVGKSAVFLLDEPYDDSPATVLKTSVVYKIMN